jgi:hypothetical protein
LLGGAEVTYREFFGKTNDGGADGTCKLELELDGKRTRCHVMIKAEFFHLTDKLRSFTLSKYDGKDWLCRLSRIVVTKAFNVPVSQADAAMM